VTAGTRLGRTVAIKVLPADLASQFGAPGRLEREAKAVSALIHPNICVLFGVGHRDGTSRSAPRRTWSGARSSWVGPRAAANRRR